MTEQPLGEGAASVPGQAVEPAALTVDASVPVAVSAAAPADALAASAAPAGNAAPADALAASAAPAGNAAPAASASGPAAAASGQAGAPASGHAPADAASGPAATATADSTDAAGDASLLALLDRLAALLERSDLTELEIEAGGTGIVLRKPGALAPLATIAAPQPPAGSGQRTETAAGTARPAAGSPGASRPVSGSSPGAGSVDAPVAAATDFVLAVRAPLTGIFYASPGPGSPPFVAVGREVVVGQVIGLIEAMKLFNEIKSDQAGRVVRVNAEDGALVKAKQPLIEVVPL